MAGYAPTTLDRAKHLRRDMTEAEKLLWKYLRNSQLGAKFRRQQPIGPFIVDFVCHELRFIIELDGGQHAGSDRDIARDRWLSGQGYLVLRLCNHDLLNNLQGSLETITAALNTPHRPTASRRAPPSPSRGEGIAADGAYRG